MYLLMRRLILSGFFGCAMFMAFALPPLSPQAEISLLTIDPGADLYSAFGHTGVRVHDPATGFDRVYNYGTFDFQPPLWKFYVNFMQGRLNYRLDTESYRRFERVYHYYGRAYFAQVLNLSQAQKQAVYEFMETNYLPENRYYLYEFFYDNCATRVRDLLKEVLGDSLHYYQPQEPLDMTFRDFLWLSLDKRRWAGFGIDLGIGAVVDRPITPWESMFLPEFLAVEFGKATVQTPRGEEALVATRRNLYPGTYTVTAEPWYIRPIFLFWLLFAVGLGLTLRQWQRDRSAAELRRPRVIGDVLLFTLSGFAGLVLLLLWVATIHTATVQNYNLLWLLPTHLVAGFALLRKRSPSWLHRYWQVSTLVTLVPILGWYVLPQHFNPAFLPWMLLLVMRSGYLWWRDRSGQVD